MDCDSILLIEDDPLDITEDHFNDSSSTSYQLLANDTFDTTLSPSNDKELSNSKLNQMSPGEENNTVNDDYKLNPSFSFMDVKLSDNPKDDNNEVNNTVNDSSILNPSFSFVQEKTTTINSSNVNHSDDDINDVPKDLQDMYKYVNNLYQKSMTNSRGATFT